MRVALPGARIMRSKGTLRSLLRLFAFTIFLRMVGAVLNAAELTIQPVEMAGLDPIIQGLFVSIIAVMNPGKAHTDEPSAEPTDKQKEPTNGIQEVSG